MFFDSYLFLFLFLPLTLAAFYISSRSANRTLAMAVLIGASFIFYSHQGMSSSLFLLGFVLGNLLIAGLALRFGRFVVIAGVLANIALLASCKFTQWMVPAGISFFTFTAIAYLVDVGRGEVREHRFLDYCFFLTFFPKLIVGPIARYKQVFSPDSANSFLRPNWQNVSLGLSLFSMGLFKKVVIASSLVKYVSPVFDAGAPLAFIDAWMGVLAYTFQIYFDFSGYSDMAIALAVLFGVRLPVNFNSPYKATSVVDFWQRWHITLSHFFRDYCFIPMSVNAKNPLGFYGNLLVMMFLVGLWHGAGWTFLVWGMLHGIYLCVNHLWRSRDVSLPRFVSRLITFLAVVVAWVFFRADTLSGGLEILKALLGNGGLGAGQASTAIWLAVLAVVTWWAPNTQEIMGKLWRPNFTWAMAAAAAAFIAVMGISELNPFIYFRF